MGQKRWLFLLAIFAVLLAFTSGRGGNETSVMILCLFPFWEFKLWVLPLSLVKIISFES